MSELEQTQKVSAVNKPSREKGAARKRKKSGKAPSPPKAGRSMPQLPKAISADVRERMIAEAAYFKAEHRGFAGGDKEQDWYDAEAEINATLLGKKSRG